MYLQGVDDVFDLVWVPGLAYGDVHRETERQFSAYDFEAADVALLERHFADHEAECRALLGCDLVLPAYDQVLKCSHIFNLLDARGAISVTERVGYITRVRNLSRSVAEAYVA
jgi:glycyl-tRNA synthetase alpha chain